MIKTSRVSRVLQFVVPYWRKLVIIFFLTISATAFGLAYPLFAQVLIDDVLLGGGNTKWLFWVALGVFGVTMLGLLLSVLNNYIYTWVSTKVLFNMRLAFYQHVQKLSLRFYSKTKVGEIMSRISSDIAAVQGVAMGALLSFVTNVLVLIISLAFCIWLNWKLFLISSVFVPLAVIALGYFRPQVANQARKIREKNADIASFLVEKLFSIKLIKASRTEELEAKRLDQKNTELMTSLIRFQILSSFASGIPAIIFALSAMIIFLYGGYQVITGALTLGSLVAFSAYQARFVGPLQSLAGLYMNLQTARVSLERVFEFMDIEPETKEKENALSLDKVDGEIKFNNVFMGYEGDDRVLKGVSFVIPPGSTFAIIGPSGAGKTTIIDLLLRFYDPQEGSIELDNYDLRDWNLNSLRKHIALVGQEVFLFYATIEENIKYAARDATRDQVIKAAKAAYIHDFIMTLPQGYDTVIGERGVNLSAGQRQRIAIARAVLADAKILILDEATSSLDRTSETYIRKALRSLAKGRTTIIVTHRLPAIKNADRILVVNQGQIIQEGTHHELLARGGLYRRLYFEDEDKRGKTLLDSEKMIWQQV